MDIYLDTPARKVQTSAALVPSDIYLLLLWEIRWHKQTEDEVKQKRQLKKNKIKRRFPVDMQTV